MDLSESHGKFHGFFIPEIPWLWGKAMRTFDKSGLDPFTSGD
jgi:hypothetical protein